MHLCVVVDAGLFGSYGAAQHSLGDFSYSRDVLCLRSRTDLCGASLV